MAHAIVRILLKLETYSGQAMAPCQNVAPPWN